MSAYFFFCGDWFSTPEMFVIRQIFHFKMHVEGMKILEIECTFASFTIQQVNCKNSEGAEMSFFWLTWNHEQDNICITKEKKL